MSKSSIELCLTPDRPRESTMDKLLLTLTLLAFASGVLCDVAQNLTEDVPTAVETQLSSVVCQLQNVCSRGNVRDDYQIIQYMGTYKLHKNPLATWNEAREICVQEGAQLAIINSNAEAKMLSDWLLRENVTQATWIGTHDLFGNWVTLTGETLAAAGYDQWLPGEPNNEGGLGHCGSLRYLNGMYVSVCNRKQPFFCKMNVW